MSDYTVTVGEGDKSSSWPNPGAEVIHDVEWRLRYGDPSRTDLLVAAREAISSSLIRWALSEEP